MWVNIRLSLVFYFLFRDGGDEQEVCHAQWISVLVVPMGQKYLDSVFYHIMNAKLYFCVCWEIVVGS